MNETKACLLTRLMWLPSMLTASLKWPCGNAVSLTQVPKWPKSAQFPHKDDFGYLATKKTSADRTLRWGSCLSSPITRMSPGENIQRIQLAESIGTYLQMNYYLQRSMVLPLLCSKGGISRPGMRLLPSTFHFESFCESTHASPHSFF